MLVCSSVPFCFFLVCNSNPLLYMLNQKLFFGGGGGIVNREEKERREQSDSMGWE